MKRLAVAATFVGAIVGAGFASGREIALYFSGTSVLTPLLSGALLGLFCFLFLEIGRATGGRPTRLSKKLSLPLNLIIRLENAVTYFAMIAGAEEIVYFLFSFSGGGIVSGILVLGLVVMGADKVKWSNLIIVPAIVILVAVLFFKNAVPPKTGVFSPLSAFSYCTMNIMGGGYLVSGYSGDFSKKDSIVTASVAGVVVTGLLYAVYCVVNVSPESAMPLLAAAEEVGLSTVAEIVAYLAVFSTLTGSLSIASANKPSFAAVITAASFVVATLGFRNLVDKAYPVLGAIGAVVSISYVFLYARYQYRKKEKRPASIGPCEATRL
ncbi:MAG: hypothetical protein IJ735_06560 [Clostridia bacterium]|nr:hypothetical protein [Clostridia bacterium]